MKYIYILFTVMLPFSFQAQCLQIELPLEEVVNEAEFIYQADVLSKESYWNDENTLIYTEYKLRPTRNFLSSINRSDIKLRTVGGTVDGITMFRSPSVELELNSQVVLFTKENEGFHEVVASTQGVYNIDQRNKTISSTFESYSTENDNFFQQISSITQLNESIQPSLFDQNFHQETSSFVSSFFPTSATAGTGSQITINGTDFGDNTGAVFFTNSNQSGVNINKFAPNIISWSDTEVVVEVPSGAGTGPIAIARFGQISLVSDNDLTVGYNELQFQTESGPETIHLFNQNGVGGMTMEYSSTFQDQPQAVSRFTEVIEHWSTISNVNWQMSTKYSPNTNPVNDGSNLVTLLPSSEFPSGVLGFYQALQVSSCGEGVILEYDIAFNESVNWNFSLNQPTNQQFDFYSIALHEAGHAHMQGHLIDPPALMHRSIGLGQVKRTPSNDEMSGAIDYIERASSVNCSAAHEPLIQTASKPQVEVCNTYRLENIRQNIWNPVYDDDNLLVAMVNPGDDLGEISYLEVDLFLTEETVPQDGEGNNFMNRLVTFTAFDRDNEIVDPLPSEFLLNIPYPQDDIDAFLNDDETTISSFEDASLIKNDLACGEAFTGEEESSTALTLQQSYLENTQTWIAKTKVSDFSSFVSSSSLPSILPVKWGDFFLTEDRNNVVINWSTFSEVNSSHFMVERSTDSGLTWENIARLNGAGESTEFIEYQHVDTQPQNGVNLYRVIQHDFDGTQDATNIESIVLDDIEDVVVVTNGKAIQLFGLDQTEITLYDVYGRVVYTSNHQLGDEHQLNHLESGIYFLGYNINEEIRNQKVILR